MNVLGLHLPEIVLHVTLIALSPLVALLGSGLPLLGPPLSAMRLGLAVGVVLALADPHSLL